HQSAVEVNFLDRALNLHLRANVVDRGGRGVFGSHLTCSLSGPVTSGCALVLDAPNYTFSLPQGQRSVCRLCEYTPNMCPSKPGSGGGRLAHPGQLALDDAVENLEGLRAKGVDRAVDDEARRAAEAVHIGCLEIDQHFVE